MGGHEHCVTDAQVHAVVARIKAGKGTIMSEALRLGCYHQSLRKHMRRLLGEQGYNRLPLRRCSSGVTRENVLAVIQRVREGATLTTEAKRLHSNRATLLRRIAVIAPDSVILRRPKTVPKFETAPIKARNDVDVPCTKEHSHRFKAGTDGDGHAFLWCRDCGHEEPVVARRLAPPAEEEVAPREDDG